MLTEKLSSQLVRQTISDFMSLPETEFVVAVEVITALKQQVREKAERRAQAAEMVAHAKQRAAELRQLPRAEVFAQFRATLETIRAHMQATGQTTDDEADWVNDD